MDPRLRCMGAERWCFCAAAKRAGGNGTSCSREITAFRPRVTAAQPAWHSADRCTHCVSGSAHSRPLCLARACRRSSWRVREQPHPAPRRSPQAHRRRTRGARRVEQAGGVGPQRVAARLGTVCGAWRRPGASRPRQSPPRLPHPPLHALAAAGVRAGRVAPAAVAAAAWRRAEEGRRQGWGHRRRWPTLARRPLPPNASAATSLAARVRM